MLHRIYKMRNCVASRVQIPRHRTSSVLSLTRSEPQPIPAPWSDVMWPIKHIWLVERHTNQSDVQIHWYYYYWNAHCVIRVVETGKIPMAKNNIKMRIAKENPRIQSFNMARHYCVLEKLLYIWRACWSSCFLFKIIWLIFIAIHYNTNS